MMVLTTSELALLTSHKPSTPVSLPNTKAELVEHGRIAHHVVRVFGSPSQNELWWEHFTLHESTPCDHTHDWTSWSVGVR